MSQFMTGARGQVKINGAAVAYISGVDVSRSFSLAEIDVLGQLEAADLAETGFKCEFSLKVFKAIDAKNGPTNSLTSIGIDKSSQAAGLNPMKMQNGFSVELLDDQSGKTLFIMEGCKLASGSGQVDARGVWQGNCSFQALRGFEP